MKLRPRPLLSWSIDGAPFADDFGDVYYSKQGGLEETRTVFLSALGLPGLWRGRSCSVIGELGFGSGLNALALWDLWRSNREPGAILHVVSIEGFPLDAMQATRALAAFPELAPLSQKLLRRWPCRAAGAHRLWFPEDGYCLTIVHEEALAALAMIPAPADAWLLDGFAPAKNPQMWSAEALAAVARLSRPGARAATYSVAGEVRRNLASAGFSVKRAPGFGFKRERLEAGFASDEGAPPPKRRPQSALIIGGGIAGACAAAALRRRGLSVTLIEKRALASGASGNPAGIVSPRLDLGDDAPGRLLRAAYLFAVDRYPLDAPGAWRACGIVRGEADADKAAKLRADPSLPEDWLSPADPAQHGLNKAAAFFLPQAGLLDPGRAIALMTQDCVVKTGATAASLQQARSQWRALDGQGLEIAAADIVVIAAGPGVERFIDPETLALDGRRGALSVAPLAKQEAAGAPMSAGAYAFAWNRDLIFGATFDAAPLDQDPSPISPQDHARNLDLLRDASPARAALLPPEESWRGRVSLRVTTPDQLPVAGAAPDITGLQPILEALRRGAVNPAAAQAPGLDGLFVLAGLGSRGLTTAPLLAEHVACLALLEPSPLSPSLSRAVDPARFLMRKARRNQL